MIIRINSCRSTNLKLGGSWQKNHIGSDGADIDNPPFRNLWQDTDGLLDSKTLDGVGSLLTSEAQIREGHLPVLVSVGIHVPQSGLVTEHEGDQVETKKCKMEYLPLGLGVLVNDISTEVKILGNGPLERLHNFFILEVVSSA